MEIRSATANNPGIFTGPGTNTYVVISAGQAVIIDPGPTDPVAVHRSHVRAVMDLVADATPVGVLVSHTHPDHAPAANPLGEKLSVPVYGFAPGPEFKPDVMLADGDIVTVGSVDLEAIHTPGHTADHLCFRVGASLFTGDHIMGGSTVIIEDAASYMDSLEKTRGLGVETLYPGHGPVLADADAVISEYVAHRQMRELQVIAALRDGATTVSGIVGVVYADVDASRHFAAAMQVRTMLAKLVSDGAVTWNPSRADGEPIELIEETNG